MKSGGLGFRAEGLGFRRGRGEGQAIQILHIDPATLSQPLYE